MAIFIPQRYKKLARCPAESAYPYLWNGLISYWDFRLPHGLTTIPNLVSGRPGLIQGTAFPTVSSGIWGRCLSFDGSTQALKTDSNLVYGTKKLTVCILFNNKVSDTSSDVILEATTDTNANDGAWIYYTNSVAALRTHIAIQDSVTTDKTTAKYYAFPAINTPMLVVFAIDNSLNQAGIILYENGMPETLTDEVSTKNQTSNIITSVFHIGARAGNTLFFNGDMYAVMLWNRNINYNELEILSNGRTPSEPRFVRRVYFVPTAVPQNFAPDCATATGQAYDPSIVASGDAPFAVDVATGTGQAYDPVIVASGSATFAPDTATGTGSAYDPGIVASGSVTFTPDTATGTGASYDPTFAFVFAPATATGTGSASNPGITATGEAPVEPDTPTGDGTAHDPSLTNIPTPAPEPTAAAVTTVGVSSSTDSMRCYGASTNADGCQTKGRRGGSNSLRSYGVSSS